MVITNQPLMHNFDKYFIFYAIKCLTGLYIPLETFPQSKTFLKLLQLLKKKKKKIKYKVFTLNAYTLLHAPLPSVNPAIVKKKAPL